MKEYNRLTERRGNLVIDNCGIAEFYPFTSPNVIETEVIGNIYEPLSQRKDK